MGAHRPPALPDLRRADLQADAAADRRPHPRDARGHPLPGARAGDPRAQGRVRRPARRPAVEGLRPGPGRRHRVPADRPAEAEEAGEAHHRGGRRPAVGAPVEQAAHHRLDRDRPRTRRRRRRAGLRRSRRGRPAPRAALLRATRLPQRPPAGHRRARAAVVLVQLALRRVPGLHRPRHPQGGRPGTRRPRPRAQPGRGRGHAVVDRPDQRVLPAAAAGRRRHPRLRHRRPVGVAAGARAEGGAARAVRAGARQLPQPLRPRPLLLRGLRGRGAVDRAALHRDRQRLLAREVRGLHARGALPDLRGHAPQAGDPRRHRRGTLHRRGVGAVDRRRRVLAGRARPRQPRRA